MMEGIKKRGKMIDSSFISLIFQARHQNNFPLQNAAGEQQKYKVSTLVHMCQTQGRTGQIQSSTSFSFDTVLKRTLTVHYICHNASRFCHLQSDGLPLLGFSVSTSAEVSLTSGFENTHKYPKMSQERNRINRNQIKSNQIENLCCH